MASIDLSETEIRLLIGESGAALQRQLYGIVPATKAELQTAVARLVLLAASLPDDPAKPDA